MYSQTGFLIVTYSSSIVTHVNKMRGTELHGCELIGLPFSVAWQIQPSYGYLNSITEFHSKNESLLIFTF